MNILKILKTNLLFLFLLTVLSTLITSCSFHLRGYQNNDNLPQFLKKVFIRYQVSNNFAFKNELKQSLTSVGATIEKNKKDATSVLVITSISSSTNTISTVGSSSSNQNEQKLIVGYEVYDMNNTLVFKSVSRDSIFYTTNNTQVLSNNTQKISNEKNLEQSVAINIANSLYSIKEAKTTITPNKDFVLN